MTTLLCWQVGLERNYCGPSSGEIFTTRTELSSSVERGRSAIRPLHRPNEFWPATPFQNHSNYASDHHLYVEGDTVARTQYVVVNEQGQWKIAFAGKHYGPYNTQANAIRAAVDAAHRAKGDAQVLVQGQNGQFRTEWTYGHDPYPPPG
jgi:hypothetical protein